MDVKRKKILVIGMARSGISAAKVLNQLGAHVVMNDLKKESEVQELIADLEPYVETFILGDHVRDFSTIDLVVISPGVPLNIEPIALAKSHNVPVIGTLELGYQLTQGEFIGITGTNGKTTTTALLGEMFNNAYLSHHVVGNIGLPVISKAFDSDENTMLITEVSSFQLETIESFKPKIASILNITPDHLNRHKTMKEYIEAKKRIFMNQDQKDFLVLNLDNDVTASLDLDDYPGQVIYFSRKRVLDQGVYLEKDVISIIDNGERIPVCKSKDIFILGDHNIENALAATAMAFYAGIPVETIARTLKTFKGVEHRIEFVLEKNGVSFYNDSKGTNPEASIKAIESMEKPTVLIAGGMDKGSDFRTFVDAFNSKIKAVILFGETKERIAETIKKNSAIEYYIVNTLKEATLKAYELASENEAVLLSPACASWDMYESYEHRGREFKEIVYEI